MPKVLGFVYKIKWANLYGSSPLWPKGFQFCNSIQTVPQKLSQHRKKVHQNQPSMTNNSCKQILAQSYDHL